MKTNRRILRAALSAAIAVSLVYQPFPGAVRAASLSGGAMQGISASSAQTFLGIIDSLSSLLDAVHRNIESISTPPPANVSLASLSGGSLAHIQPVIYGGSGVVTLSVMVSGGSATYSGISGLSDVFSFEGGSFPGAGGTCATTLSDGCTIVLAFAAPSDGADGGVATSLGSWRYASHVSLAYTSGGFAGLTSPVVIFGEAIAPPTLSVSLFPGPAGSNTPPVRAGRFEEDAISAGLSFPASYPFSNRGNASVTSIAADFSPPFYADTPSSYSCASYGCTLKFIFRPLQPGMYTQQATIAYDDGTGPRVKTVQITKTAAAPFDASLTPSQNLLVVYNDQSVNGRALESYYLAHRPGFSSANVLAVHYPSAGCVSNCPDPDAERVSSTDFQNDILLPVKNWIASNPSKSIRYIVLIEGIPTRTYPVGNQDGSPSVDWSVRAALSPLDGSGLPLKTAGVFVTHLDMGSLAASEAYVDKLASMYAAMPMPSVFISSQGTGKSGATYYLEDIRNSVYASSPEAVAAKNAILAEDPTASVSYRDNGSAYFQSAQDVLGFFSWGTNGGRGGNYVHDIQFSGNSGWYVIQTAESFNGQRSGNGWQGDYVKWFSQAAFGGSNYENTPVGAVGHTEEPGLGGINDPGKYFGCWNAGELFADCAWESNVTGAQLVVGDPWVRK